MRRLLHVLPCHFPASNDAPSCPASMNAFLHSAELLVTHNPSIILKIWKVAFTRAGAELACIGAYPFIDS